MRNVMGASLVAFAVSLSLPSSAAAEPPGPGPGGGYNYDQLQGWCEENHGFFWADDYTLSTYGCMLDDGTLVVCTATDFGSTCEVEHAHGVAGRLHSVLVGEGHLLKSQTGITKELTGVANDVKSILATQGLLAAQMSGLQNAVRPDLLPLGLPAVVGPAAYCRKTPDGTALQVVVYNQGGAPAGASTTRVTFATASGPLKVDMATPALTGPGGSNTLQFEIPVNCTGSSDLSCDFAIGVDALNQLVESNKSNNTVAGTCVTIIP